MKHIILSIVAFFLVLFAYTKLAGPLPFSITSVTTNKNDIFAVTGEGKVSIAPDIAYVTVGVQAQAKTVKDVQAQLNSAMGSVTEAIKKIGIDGKDIKSENYSIYPTYDYTGSQQRITGYNASSNLEVKIKDIEKVNAVIDGATGAGANTVGNVTFSVEDKEKAQNEARKLAVAEAKKKAENAASIAGFRLGNIINYTESFDGEPRPIPMYAKAEGMGGGPSGDTQIQPGSNEIRVTVTLEYELQ